MTLAPRFLRRLFARPAGPSAADLVAAGDAARDARQWDQAAERYGAALRLHRGLPHIWVQRGHALKEAGDFPAAEAAYREALTQEPANADTHLNLGHLLKLAGRLGEAADSYVRAAEFNPAAREPRQELRAVLARLEGVSRDPITGPPPKLPAVGQTARSAADAQRLLAEADRAFEARNWCAAAHGYAAALTFDPTQAGAWASFGRALLENGDAGLAETACRQALEYDPQDAALHLALGGALQRQGRAGEAAEWVLRALRARPGWDEARQALVALADDGASAPPAVLAEALGYPFGPEELSPDHGVLVFDIADLLEHLRHVRRPTGIQRVQIEVIRALARRKTVGLRLVGYSPALDDWIAFPLALFEELRSAAVDGADAGAARWIATRETLSAFTGLCAPFVFPPAAVLVNLGTSWIQPNYFLNLRRARDSAGVRFVPFVHDLIPLVSPENHLSDVRRAFVSWLAGVLAQADGILVNSRSTLADLKRAARSADLVLPSSRIAVVPLNGDFRRLTAAVDRAILERLHLAPRSFVLFVSTFEVRKNHAAAFQAWARLMAEVGGPEVPTLVCVGRRGWMHDDADRILATTPALEGKILMLEGVSDPELAALYEASLFTLYPSLYEGWGLPISEALAFGRPVLAARAASLPEAGGRFADYFDPASPDDLAAKLRRLIFDPAYRRRREAAIRRGYRPRSWDAIADQVVESVRRWPRRPAVDRPAVIQADRYYSIGQPAGEGPRLPDMVGERLRAGAGWWQPEDWGCWTRPGGGELQLTAPKEAGLTLYVGLLGPPGLSGCYEIDVPGLGRAAGVLKPDGVTWASVGSPAPGARLVVSVQGAPEHVLDGAGSRPAGVGVLGCVFRRDARPITAAKSASAEVAGG